LPGRKYPVLGRTTGNRVFRIQGAVAEGLDQVHVNQWEHVFFGQHLNLLDFV
jgi:hypothetical protein